MAENYGKNGLMVYCPTQGQSLSTVAAELLGKGAKLAQERGLPLVAAMAGSHIGDKALLPAKYGAVAVFYVEHPELEHYIPSQYANALSQILRISKPEILLVGATAQGRDLAARTAARMGTGLTADCTQLDIQEGTGLLLQTRPAYGGRVKAAIVCREKRPQMASVRPGVFPMPNVVDNAQPPCIINVSAQFSPENTGTQLLHKRKTNKGENPLKDAEVVLCCGRGVQNPQGLQMAKKLAERLNGVLAGTRGLVEEGLMPATLQVGQTGQTVRPRLYIACGVSGAVQHMVGMQESECVIAINIDANAPIMAMADFKICADVMEAIPKLMEII